VHVLPIARTIRRGGGASRASILLGELERRRECTERTERGGTAGWHHDLAGPATDHELRERHLDDAA